MTQHVDLERSDGPGSTAATADHRPADLAQVADIGGRIAAAISQVVLGKAEVIRLAIVAVLSEGHLLIEDVPGTGKTVLAKALAKTVDSTVSRVQFTPDLMPSDVTGVSVYDRQTSRFEFRAGPIFANIVVADEINRASPKTQSALLECMEERQVTVDGTSYHLARPFLVLATQNPVEMEGTYPLPEAQRDRFLARLSIGYPDRNAEIGMLADRDRTNPARPAATGDRRGHRVRPDLRGTDGAPRTRTSPVHRGDRRHHPQRPRGQAGRVAPGGAASGPGGQGGRGTGRAGLRRAG